MAVINPFDFFVEPYAEKLPFAFPAELRDDLAAYRRAPEPAGPLLAELIRLDPARRAQHRSISWSISISGCSGDPLPDPHGARRADAGGDA